MRSGPDRPRGSTLVGTALLGAAATLTARAVLPRVLARMPGGQEAWERTNHAGAPLTLQGGLAWVAGAAVAAPGASGRLSVAVPAALGVLDDQRGDADRRGLRGHLQGLAHGDLTTGGIKVLGLAAGGVVVVALADHEAASAGAGRAPWWSTLTGGALVAGCANLVNLFDLRPGRALKVVLLLVTVPAVTRSAGAATAAAGLGASLAALPSDLAGETMLGDTGANPAGALAGLALARSSGPAGRLLGLAVVSALTLASERVSFSRVIASTPWLDRIDRLGRPRAPGR